LHRDEKGGKSRAVFGIGEKEEFTRVGARIVLDVFRRREFLATHPSRQEAGIKEGFRKL